MTKQGFCRTGQVAQALGLSAHQVRRLCESGMIEAELGPGGHWRIPVGEVARLQKEGVPLIPSAVDDSEPEEGEFEIRSRAVLNASPRHDVLALSSGSLIASDREEGHVASNCLERPKNVKRTELEADWFRDRNGQPEEIQATATQPLGNGGAALQAAQAREQWHHRWLDWALASMPWDVPDESRLDVRQEVDKTLQSLQPQTPESLMYKLVEGAVQKGLRTWRSVQDTEKALGDALRMLPWSATSLWHPTKWQIRAREEASCAISKLPDGASFDAKLAAATVFVQKITLEFEEQTLRQKIIDESIPLALLSSAEQEDVKAAIRASVESSPPGSDEAELRGARWAALKPFEDRQRQKQERHRLERKVDQGLAHIRTFLDQLWDEGELEGFGDRSEVWRYANEIREDVRAELLGELEGRQEVSDDKIRAMIEAIVDDLLSD